MLCLILYYILLLCNLRLLAILKKVLIMLLKILINLLNTFLIIYLLLLRILISFDVLILCWLSIHTSIIVIILIKLILISLLMCVYLIITYIKNLPNPRMCETIFMILYPPYAFLSVYSINSKLIEVSGKVQFSSKFGS